MAYKPCKWVGLTPGQTMRKDNTYPCLAPVSEPVLPNSVSASPRYHWPPSRIWISKEICEGCPVYDVADAKLENSKQE